MFHVVRMFDVRRLVIAEVLVVQGSFHQPDGHVLLKHMTDCYDLNIPTHLAVMMDFNPEISAVITVINELYSPREFAAEPIVSWNRRMFDQGIFNPEGIPNMGAVFYDIYLHSGASAVQVIEIVPIDKGVTSKNRTITEFQIPPNAYLALQWEDVMHYLKTPAVPA